MVTLNAGSGLNGTSGVALSGMSSLPQAYCASIPVVGRRQEGPNDDGGDSTAAVGRRQRRIGFRR
jgi:hypothetical protein